MALKRTINNYQLKLFLPIAAVMWVFIIVFTLVQERRENAYRSEVLRSRVELINHRVIDLYEQGEDPGDYMHFVDKYFDQTVLDGLSVTLFDTRSGTVIRRIGFPAPPPDMLHERQGHVTGRYIQQNNNDSVYYFQPDQAFYYNIDTTADGNVLVQTILPNDPKVISEVHNSWWWWLTMLLAFALVTVVTYFTTAHLARNVKLLSSFARSAAADKDFVTIDKFPNDELGEISRQIVNIYNTRKAALASKELEHRIAIKATEDRSLLRKQLTNNINHELKTPAGIVKGYLETIVDNPDMDEASRNHFLTKSRDQIERLCNILNDISTMTRLEEGGAKVKFDPIDFHDFVEDLAIDVDESHLIGNMEFIVDIPEGIIVKANHTLLSGALTNLIKNAANYSHGTEMGISMLTSNRRFYTFVFWDNGVGVGEEHIPMLFERFYRVDKGRTRQAGGTGLGLPIVRSSLNTMGGTISVKNREGGGLEFIFTLNRWDKITNAPDSPFAPDSAGPDVDRDKPLGT